MSFVQIFIKSPARLLINYTQAAFLGSLLCFYLCYSSACLRPSVRFCISLLISDITPDDTLYATGIPPTTAHTPLEQLGRYLFFDPRLSATGTKSCSSCHDPGLFFTDGYRRSPGIYADPATRNAPSLINTALFHTLNWANPSITTFQEQMLRPLFNDFPAEMGLKGEQESLQARHVQDLLGLPFQQIIKQLAKDTTYEWLSAAIWGIPPDQWTQHHVIEAIAAYEKTLISFNSPYDNWLNGHQEALSPEAEAGRQLFFSQRLGCGNCHSGPLLTDQKMYNIGLNTICPDKNKYQTDQGLYHETLLEDDRGKFRTPSLRNVAHTAPYFHDGSVENLSQVLQLFSAGGRFSDKETTTDNGWSKNNKSIDIQPFTMNSEEQRQLLLFLESLTDSTILYNPWFQNPFQY